LHDHKISERRSIQYFGTLHEKQGGRYENRLRKQEGVRMTWKEIQMSLHPGKNRDDKPFDEHNN